MPVTNQDYSNTADKNHTEDVEAITGEGGGFMAIYSDTRVNLVENLLRPGTTDKTTFGLPTAVYNSNADPYQNTWYQSEKAHGVWVNLSPIAANNSPIGGSLTVSIGGEDKLTRTTLRQFLIGGPVPDGVESGGDVELQTVDVEFVPEVDGLSIVREDVKTNSDLGLVKYGELTGTVTGVRGDPAPNVLITTEGGGTQTGQDGTYSVQSPGGITQTFTSLYGYDKDLTITGGQSNTVNWQFAGVLVKVRLVDGSAVVGARVKEDITGQSKRTDENGNVLFSTMTPLASGTINILGQIDFDITMGDEGEEKTVKRQFGAGLRGNITEALTGDVIRGVDIKVEGADLTAESSDAGFYSIGAVGSGEKVITIADEDRRYTSVTVTINAGRDEILQEDVELSRQDNIGTTV